MLVSMPIIGRPTCGPPGWVHAWRAEQAPDSPSIGLDMAGGDRLVGLDLEVEDRSGVQVQTPWDYSKFCTCSRICSTSTFISTEIAVSSIAGDLLPSVLASR